MICSAKNISPIIIMCNGLPDNLDVETLFEKFSKLPTILLVSNRIYQSFFLHLRAEVKIEKF